MLTDTAERYGSISRALHWMMAMLLAWQFTGMVLAAVLGRVPLTGFWVGTHVSVGVLLFVGIVVRLAWALSQRNRRRTYRRECLEMAPRAGHAAMYVLMLVVPPLGL